MRKFRAYWIFFLKNLLIRVFLSFCKFGPFLTHVVLWHSIIWLRVDVHRFWGFLVFFFLFAWSLFKPGQRDWVSVSRVQVCVLCRKLISTWQFSDLGENSQTVIVAVSCFIQSLATLLLFCLRTDSKQCFWFSFGLVAFLKYFFFPFSPFGNLLWLKGFLNMVLINREFSSFLCELILHACMFFSDDNEDFFYYVLLCKVHKVSSTYM